MVVDIKEMKITILKNFKVRYNTFLLQIVGTWVQGCPEGGIRPGSQMHLGGECLGVSLLAPPCAAMDHAIRVIIAFLFYYIKSWD